MNPRPPMTYELRDALHEWADSRARRALGNTDPTGRMCGRCGVEVNLRTRGCKACADRHCHRRLRRRAA